jgi:hypothetical protein
MSKILNLRKKPAQPKKTASSPPQPREKIGTVENKTFEAEKPQISWEAPSFCYNPQKRYLYLIAAALLAGAVALLVFKYVTLTSILLILSSLVLLLYSNQKPTISKITVNQSGVLVDDIMYYHKDLKSFWIEYDPEGLKELSLESAKWYMPYIKVLLNEQNPIEVRSLIVNFLPEKEHEISLVDHMGRKLGL